MCIRDRAKFDIYMSAPFSFPDLKPLKLRTDNDDQSTISGELAKVESVVEQLGKRFYDNTLVIQRSISAVLERIGE